MFTWHFCIFGEKKTFLENHIGKSCVGRKDCHRWTLPENTIFEISYLHLATSTASLHQQNPPAHHHTEVSRVCASIFLSQRGSTWHIPCQVCTSLTNHRALFTTTKTQLFRIHYSACSRSGWSSFISFYFESFSFDKYSKLYLDATSGDVLLHELNVQTTSLKRTKKLFMSFKKRKREEAEGEEEQGGQDEARSCLLLHLVLSGLQGKNETLSFPFFMGRRKKNNFIFGAGRNVRVPRPLLRWSPLCLFRSLLFKTSVLLYSHFPFMRSFWLVHGGKRKLQNWLDFCSFAECTTEALLKTTNY